MGIGGLADLAGLAGVGGASDTTIPAATQWKIEIDGTELPRELDEYVEEILVDEAQQMPAALTLVFRDYRRKVLSQAKIQIGAKVRISTTEPGGKVPQRLFYGEVTSIEAQYDARGMRAVVRGFDLLHRLMAGRKTRAFTNATYADIAEDVAKAAGLDADTDAAGAAHDHVLQMNQSDLDFLRTLAARLDFDVGIDEEKLLFKEAGKAANAPGAADGSRTKPTQLVWSDNLLRFTGRVSAVSQVASVNVRGWDPTAKQAVIGKAEAAATSASLKLKPADLARRGETLVVVDRAVSDQGGADNLAKSIAAQVSSAAFEATAVAVGSPAFRAGAAVSVSDVDPSLAGDYVISRVRHELGSAGPYRTELEFTGRQDRSIHGLLANGFGPGAGSIPGVVVAIVSDNKDPDELGRVKVKFPWLADDVVSTWARVATIGAGMRKGKGGHGIAWVPEPDEEVLVAFLHGDVSMPVVVGTLWNGVDKPPDMMGSVVDRTNGEVRRVGVVSRNGHGLVFHDSDFADKVVLGTIKGQTIELDRKKQSITIECDGKVIEIKSSGNLALKADGNISIEAGGSLEMKSSAAMTIKGSRVDIN